MPPEPLEAFEFELKPMGDSALFARLKLPLGVQGSFELDVESRYQRMLAARKLAGWLQKARPQSEFVAGYDSVLAPFDPSETSFREMAAWVAEQITALRRAPVEEMAGSGRLHRVPVVYGGDYGPDLAEVARQKELTAEQVIAIHSSAIYTGYLAGFIPGFTYLGPLPEAINLPRRASPRPKVPALSVALAGGLTGVYPADAPGGWHLIGYTPLSMFEKNQNPPIRFLPGDSVQFFPISPSELAKYQNAAHDLTSSLS